MITSGGVSLAQNDKCSGQDGQTGSESLHAVERLRREVQVCKNSEMRIPYVIDNETAVLRDILRNVLATHAERSLDVATAYFTVGGFALLRES